MKNKRVAGLGRAGGGSVLVLAVLAAMVCGHTCVVAKHRAAFPSCPSAKAPRAVQHRQL